MVLLIILFYCIQLERAKWAKCAPTIRAMFTQPGSMNVSWEPPPKEAKTALRGYQVNYYTRLLAINHFHVSFGLQIYGVAKACIFSLY